MGQKFNNQNKIVMTLEKCGAILKELETMERGYEAEQERANKADIAFPMSYDEFVEDGLKRIAERQDVGIEVVRIIYNMTRNED